MKSTISDKASSVCKFTLITATLFLLLGLQAVHAQPSENRSTIVSVAGPMVLETNGPLGSAFVILCDCPFVVNATVFWTLENGSATAPSDYMADSGSFLVTGGGGVEMYQVPVTINGDMDFEPDETFNLRITGLSQPDNPANTGFLDIGVTSGSLTILNDDAPPPEHAFNITKTYSDSNMGDVNVAVECDIAQPGGTTMGLSTTINVPSGDTNCQVTEQAPVNYTPQFSGACSVPVALPGGSSDCTIHNSGTAQVTVQKTYTDGNTAAVNVTLMCNGATIDSPATQSVSPGPGTTWNLSEVTAGASCTANEEAPSIPPGYVGDDDACGMMPVSVGGTPSCVITNSATAVFSVNKLYSDMNPSPVDVVLECTGATIVSPVNQTVTPGMATQWNLIDLQMGASCNATEVPMTVPAGYTPNNVACQSIGVVAAGTPSCTITNQQNPVTVTVMKDYPEMHPNGDPQVDITLTCPAGVIVDGGTNTATKPTSGGEMRAIAFRQASFQVTNFDYLGSTCVATEMVPAGYIQDDATGCDALRVLPGIMPDPTCTITNRPTEAEFTVDKVFSDANEALSATVTPVCMDSGGGDITYSETSGSASDAMNFGTTVKYFEGDTNCTATELDDLLGYTQEDYVGNMPPAPDCTLTGVAIDDATDGLCVIFNQQDPVNITITKDYMVTHPLNTDPQVNITLSCETGTVNDGTISESDMTDMFSVTFVVSNFLWDGETCVATEAVPAGYVLEDDTGCDGLYVEPGITPDPNCTITNRPTEAVLTVDKVFSDTNPMVLVDVTPECIDEETGPGITFSPDGGDAGHNTDFMTTIRYFAGVTSCGASEEDPVGYTLVDGQSSCVARVPVIDGAETSCVLFNQQDPVDILASKVYTEDGGPAATFAAACDAETLTVVSNTASPGNPAVYTVSNFPWDGIHCDVTEPVPPDYYYEVDSSCNNLTIVPSDDDTLCTITNAPTEVTFNVSKNFTDDEDGGPLNPTEVEVTLDCFSGLPITQTQTISQSQDVTFTVQSFIHGGLNCKVTENIDAPELEGYTPSYVAGVLIGNGLVSGNGEACEYSGVLAGEVYVCEITNDADEVEVTIEKVWLIEGTGGDYVDRDYTLELFCDAPITLGSTSCGIVGRGDYNELYCKTYNGNGDDSFTALVTPEWPSSECWVVETINDDAVDKDNDCQFGDLTISHGVGNSCVITNSVFFEGIPTLSQYGVAILALLMLMVGMISFRRYS